MSKSENILCIYSADNGDRNYHPGFDWDTSKSIHQGFQAARQHAHAEVRRQQRYDPREKDNPDGAVHCFRIFRLFSAVDKRNDVQYGDPSIMGDFKIVFRQLVETGQLDDTGVAVSTALQDFINSLEEPNYTASFVNGLHWLVEKGKKVHGTQA